MKWIKNHAPVIMLAYSLVFAIACIWCPNDLYKSFIYDYLSQLLGFSFFTNMVFLPFYFNRHYCWTIKFAVIGLFLMNVITIICIYSKVSPYLYDVCISLICLLVYISHKIIKEDESREPTKYK